MKPLAQLPVELKALNTAALIFVGLAVLMGLLYVDVSHLGAGGSYWIGPSNIAETYYGPGVGLVALISLAHIHMLGLFPVFWVVGFIFAHSSLRPCWKSGLVALPFAGFLLDVCGWFLTKTAPGFVYIVLLGGGLFVLAIASMVLLSLYEMWIGPLRRLPPA